MDGSDWRRRRMLKAIGVFGTAGIAGCLNSDQNATPRRTGSAVGTISRTEHPNETAADSRESTDDSASGTDRSAVDGTSEVAPERFVEEWSRNDVPPYEIDRPEVPRNYDDSTAWNPEDDWDPDYLGAGMPTEPSLAFTTLERFPFPDRDWEFRGTESFVTELMQSREDMEALLDLGGADPATRDRLDAVDFEESVLVFLGDCCGSSSVSHGWGRIEETPDGIHLHGYRTDPWLTLDDISSRLSLLEVERPAADLDLARVSFTIDEETRVHFDTDDGPIGLRGVMLSNDHPEDLVVSLRIVTAGGDVRVDADVPIQNGYNYKGIGLVSEADTELTVDVAVESHDIDVTHTYTGAHTMGIRLEGDGSVAVGPSNEV